MTTSSYGVVWREQSLPVATGKLELLPDALRFEGMADGRPTTRERSRRAKKRGRTERPSDRLNGCPSLVVERRSGRPITIASVGQTGVVAELAERLASLQLGPDARRRTAFVLPLGDGGYAPALDLLREGPPFNPEETGLDRHEVYLTQNEVVFVFESRLGTGALEPLLADPALWLSAAAWGDLLAGPPRVAEDVYSWERPSGAGRQLLPAGLRSSNGNGSA